MQLRPDPNDIRLGGIVYTPIKVAEELCRLALTNLDKLEPKILEPSAGDGAFLASLQKTPLATPDITAIDIDPQATDYLAKEFKNAKIIESDYLRFVSRTEAKNYDLIIGNPPYIRRHNFSDVFMSEVTSLSESISYPISQLKNAWAAFTLGSIKLLSDDGILALVVPYELLTVHYGQFLQDHLVQEFHRIDIFVPDEKAFKKIDQDAVALIASKRETGKAGLHIHRVYSLSDLEPVTSKAVDMSGSENLSIDLKSFLFDSDTTELLHKLRAKLNTVLDYCDSSAGIVTAANEFFILKREDVERFGLQPWARKILKKGSFLSSGPEFKKRDFNRLEKKEPCYLIDFQQENSAPLTLEATEYIKRGEEQEIDLRYKCRNREPWYRVPIVPVSEGFFFKRSHKYPRICSNEARVLVTDTAYQVRMKDGFEIQDLTYSFYNSLTLLFSEINGRFYGGGVLELTPSEFKSLPLVFQKPTKKEYSAFVKRFPAPTQNQDNLFDIEDDWLRNKLQMLETDMEKLQNALIIVRNHRLRHGKSLTNKSN